MNKRVILLYVFMVVCLIVGGVAFGQKDSRNVKSDSLHLTLLDETVCENDSVTITAIVNGGTLPYSYLWSTGDISSYITVPGINQTYTFTVTDSSGSQIIDSAVVSALPLPTVSVAGDTNVCAGAAASFIAAGASQWRWFNGMTSSVLTIKLYSSAVIYVTGTDNNNCSSTDSIMVTVREAPSVSIIGRSDICLGEVDTLTAVGNGSLLWTPGDSTVEQIIVSTSVDVTYSVEVNNDCGSAKDEIVIGVHDYPVADAGEDEEITRGNSVTLDASTAADYVWSPAIGLSCVECKNPIATPLETTTYTLKVSSIYGCSDTDDVEIKVKWKMFVPNIFSPNQDGNNDVFYIRGINNVDVNLYIYNQSGAMVFESNDLNKGWDGNFKGEPVPEGVYVYYIRIQTDNDEIIEEKGDLTLIR